MFSAPGGRRATAATPQVGVGDVQGRQGGCTRSATARPVPPGDVLASPGAGPASRPGRGGRAATGTASNCCRRWEGAPALRAARDAPYRGRTGRRWLRPLHPPGRRRRPRRRAVAVLLTGCRPAGAPARSRSPPPPPPSSWCSPSRGGVPAQLRRLRHRGVPPPARRRHRSRSLSSGTAAYAAGPALERLAVLGADRGGPRGRRPPALPGWCCSVGGGAGCSPTACSPSGSSAPRRGSCRRPAATRPPACVWSGACVPAQRRPGRRGRPVLGPPEAAVDALRTCHADTVCWQPGPTWRRRTCAGSPGTSRAAACKLLVAPRVAEVAATRLHLRAGRRRPAAPVEEPEFTGARRVAKAALDYGLARRRAGAPRAVLLAVAAAVRARRRRGRSSSGRSGSGGTAASSGCTSSAPCGWARSDELAALGSLNEHDGGRCSRSATTRGSPRWAGCCAGGRWTSCRSCSTCSRARCPWSGPRPPLLARGRALRGRRPPPPARQARDHRAVAGVRPQRPVLGGDRAPDLSYVENWHLGLDLRIIAADPAAPSLLPLRRLLIPAVARRASDRMRPCCGWV